MFKPVNYTALSIASALLLSVGCQQQTPPVVHGEIFPPDNQQTDSGRLYESQAASGAVTDGTLYACHFSGDSLNSLGTYKLDLIVKASGSAPVNVWTCVPDDQTGKTRQQAVIAYLTQHGVAAAQIHVASGTNPDTDHPAAEGIRDLSKTDSDSSTSAGSSAGSASANTGGSH